MKIWILTSTYNDYDQHGDYFIAWWSDKPSVDQMMGASNRAGHNMSAAAASALVETGMFRDENLDEGDIEFDLTHIEQG